MEEAFRLLTENINDYAIFMLDRDGNILSWNEGAKKLLGWLPEEILGNHFTILFTPEDIKKKIPEMELNIAATKGQSPDKRFHVTKDGHQIFVNGSIAAMKDEFGRTSGYVKIFKESRP